MHQKCFGNCHHSNHFLGVYMADVHNDLLEWLKFDKMTHSFSGLKGSDNLDNVEAALIW